mmetsp:Transcript_1091/g.1447  ORF Transcript_1091/g.1447 Transcript_1091/m.1447 type:complete len:370 (+) Transcript_1091:29-1138(+)
MATFKYNCAVNEQKTTKIMVSNNIKRYIDGLSMNIPNELLFLIQYFYKIEYKIYGNKPKTNECDYVIQLLKPIKMLGITHGKTSKLILEVTSKYARNNIICLSKIIQINNIYFNNKNSSEYNDTIGIALDNAKVITPSYIIFRCNKELKTRGIHFQIDITCKYNKIFPYYMFNKNTLTDIFKRNNINIMTIYCNNKCINGKYGVSILLFIESETDINVPNLDNIYKNISNNIDNDLEYNFVEKIFSIKGNGINCGCSNMITNPELWELNKKPIARLIYPINCYDTNGNKCWCLVLISIDKVNKFKFNVNDNLQYYQDNGHILYVSYGLHQTDKNFYNKINVSKVVDIIKGYKFQYDCYRDQIRYNDHEK